MLLAIFALVNGHKRRVGEDVFIHPDLECQAFGENHLFGWSEKAKGFSQKDEVFEKFEQLLLLVTQFSVFEVLKEVIFDLRGLKKQPLRTRVDDLNSRSIDTNYVSS